jgi:hypothetical protein
VSRQDRLRLIERIGGCSIATGGHFLAGTRALCNLLMAETSPLHSSDQIREHEIEYRSVEPWALVALGFGILSAAALLGSLPWLLSVLGIVASLIALYRLKANSNRIGRAAALAGLGLSVLFGVVPIAHSATSFVLLSRQARTAADQWFEYLRNDSPEKALMLGYAPDRRQPLDESVWPYFQHDKDARAQLEQFVRHPVVRTLLALGPKAQVRFYKTSAVGTEGTRGMVKYYYTVTYPDGDGKKTFFVAIVMERKPTVLAELNPWRVADIQGGFDPSKPIERKQ